MLICLWHKKKCYKKCLSTVRSWMSSEKINLGEVKKFGGGSSSSDNSGGGSSSSDNSGVGTAGGNSNGEGGSGSSNMATSSPSTSSTQQTCPDDLILNTDGKCVPKNQSTIPMQTGNTGGNTTNTQKKIGVPGDSAGTTYSQGQTGNVGGSTGATTTSSSSCQGLSQFDPTTGSCTSENPSTSTTSKQTGNTGGSTGITTPATPIQTGNNNGGSTGTECQGLSQFDPTTGSCTSENPSTTSKMITGGAKTIYGIPGPATTSTTTTPKSMTLPTVPAVFGICSAGTKIGDKCVLGVDSCRTSGGTVTGDQCVYNTPSTPTPTTTPIPNSISQQGNCQSGAHMINGNPNNCADNYFPYDDGTCPPGRIHLPGPDQHYCSIPPVLPGSTTGAGGGFIQMIPANPSSARSTTSSTPATTSSEPVKVNPVNGKCPAGSHSIGTEDDGITPWCVEDNPATGTPATTTGSGTTTNTSSTTSTPKQVEVPPLQGGHGCPYGSYSVGSSGNAGQPGTGSIICISTPGATTSTQTGFHVDAYGALSKDANPDGSCPQGTAHHGPLIPCFVDQIPANQDESCPVNTSHFPGADPKACYSSSVVNTATSGGSSTGTTTNAGGTTSTPMTMPMKTGGATTTGTGTATPTNGAGGTGRSTSTSTTTTTTKIINNNNVVRGGPSASASTVGSTQAPATTTPSVTYVNIPDKITIRYPSTWTKTEFANNPSIPVIFNTPINGSTATTTKTTLMVNINNQLTPSSATPDSYTQQQINALTNSSVIKYTITDTNSKVLAPPAGITAYREISYNGIKNSTANNNIPTQIPLKGTAIFFVNGNTGYTLLYLAKQTEYSQSLPTVQQMINTFQINATSSGVGVGSGSGPTGGSSNGGGNNG